MRLALQLNDAELVEDIFSSCLDTTVKRQLAFMLGRQQFFLRKTSHKSDYK
jgi:26S proteasome regulatory subunit N1